LKKTPGTAGVAEALCVKEAIGQLTRKYLSSSYPRICGEKDEYALQCATNEIKIEM
jgi:hypothetical protein